MSKASLLPRFTFMQAWGQLVWMTGVIAILGSFTWYTLGPLSAAFTTLMLTCTEMVMFLIHVLRYHDEDGHPLHQRFIEDKDVALIAAGVSMTALAIWVGLISIWTTSQNGWSAFAITLVLVAQACASELIHMIAHRKQVFGTGTGGAPHSALIKLVVLQAIMNFSAASAWHLLT